MACPLCGGSGQFGLQTCPYCQSDRVVLGPKSFLIEGIRVGALLKGLVASDDIVRARALLTDFVDGQLSSDEIDYVLNGVRMGYWED